MMLDFFNELMTAFQIFVNALFNDLTFYGDITYGMMIVACGCMYIVIRYFIGRLK